MGRRHCRRLPLPSRDPRSLSTSACQHEEAADRPVIVRAAEILPAAPRPPPPKRVACHRPQIEVPVIRGRQAAEAITGKTTIEGITAKDRTINEAFSLWNGTSSRSRRQRRPSRAVSDRAADATRLRNLGNLITDAPVVALGPGHRRRRLPLRHRDDARHNLCAHRPGSVELQHRHPGRWRHDKNRVLHSPRAGIFNSDRPERQKGDVIATVDGEPIIAKISGNCAACSRAPSHHRISRWPTSTHGTKTPTT